MWAELLLQRGRGAGLVFRPVNLAVFEISTSIGNIFLLVALKVAPITLLALALGLTAQLVLSGLQTAPELMLRLIP